MAVRAGGWTRLSRNRAAAGALSLLAARASYARACLLVLPGYLYKHTIPLG